MKGLAPGLGAALVYAAGSFSLPFFELRQNRGSSGEGMLLATLLPAVALAGIALAAAFSIALILSDPSARPRVSVVSGIVADVSAMAAAPLLLGALAAGSVTIADPAAAPASSLRISFGSGFMLALAASYVMTLAAANRTGNAVRKGRITLRTAFTLAAATFAVLAISGSFDSLGIAMEFANRREAFLDSAARHAAYAFGATAAAALFALPLGRAATKIPRIEKPLFFVATAVQTIPTLSLLGLLILPLSALGAAVPFLHAIGVRGIGWAPASIALFLYAILPIAANAHGGFKMVPAAAIDAGKGLGMGRASLFFRVELPLAAPSLIAGIRTALAQNLGNAVLAGLIGGGGLGSIVFLGLAQAAPDLILLGALPVVAAAFAADRLLGMAESGAARHAGLEPDGEPGRGIAA